MLVNLDSIDEFVLLRMGCICVFAVPYQIFITPRLKENIMTTDALSGTDSE